jgi:argininosuccinate lyase
MASKLWDKGYQLDPVVEQFTVGDDHVLDVFLAEHDILGSIAHARMLASIGILSDEERASITGALKDILETARAGEFTISPRQEDVHTAVEEALVEKLGDAGKKVHTGRSRNDQVLLDTRMYTRERLLAVWKETAAAAGKLLDFAKTHEFVPMPGRTHTQRAMPSSVGTWAGAFAESLLDDIEMLKCAYRLINQCPLGSAASYGVKLPLDRQMVSDSLGFEKAQNNVLYVQNSRGKLEAVVVFALSQITDDLARLSGDTIMFSMPEFGYFTLPDEFCPGSSIMPQKKNPGPLELVRARAEVVSSLAFRISSIVRNLPSGYNRDLQETKGPLMQAFDTALGCVVMIGKIFEGLTVNEDTLKESFSEELFAADRANELAAEGMPFRDAYKKVAAELDVLESENPVANIKAKKHIGAPGNLALDDAAGAARTLREAAESESGRLAAAIETLLEE